MLISAYSYVFLFYGKPCSWIYQVTFSRNKESVHFSLNQSFFLLVRLKMKARSKTQVRPEVCKFIKIANISTPCTGLLLRQNVYYEQELPKSMFTASTKITTKQNSSRQYLHLFYFYPTISVTMLKITHCKQFIRIFKGLSFLRFLLRFLPNRRLDITRRANWGNYYQREAKLEII